MYVEILLGMSNMFRAAERISERKHSRLTSKSFLYTIMLEHKTGSPSAEYAAKIPYFIIAALGINETESVRSIARKTGFNPTTVSRYISRLLKNGTVVEVPSGAVRYRLAEPEKKENLKE